MPNPQPGTLEWLALYRKPDWKGHDSLYLDNPELDDPEPTDAPPGSPAKLEILAARAASGQALWHPEDRHNCEGLVGAFEPRHPNAR